MDDNVDIIERRLKDADGWLYDICISSSEGF
jgi:hypothetical protein